MSDQATEKPTTVTEFETIAQRPHTIEPINTANGLVVPREVTFEFQKRIRKTEGKPDKVSGSWRATTVRMVDGQPDEVEGRATTAKKALESLLKAVSSSVSIDDYSEAFLADEFYAQKLAESAKADFDGDAKIDFDGQEMTLSELAMLANSEAEQAQEAETGAQSHQYKLAEMVNAAYIALGRDHKVLSKWATSSGNATALTHLGKGVNALRELIDIARLRDCERRVAPVSVRSGKAFNKLRIDALKTLIEGVDGDTSGPVYRFAADNKFSEDECFGVNEATGRGLYDESGSRHMTPAKIAEFLRVIASDARLTDISQAADLPLGDLSVEFDKRVEERMQRFLDEGGKFYTGYDKVQKNASLRVFGLVHAASFEGVDAKDGHNSAGSFWRAAEYARKLKGAIDGKVDSEIEKRLKLAANPRQEPFVAMVESSLRSVLASREKEAATAQAAAELEEMAGDDVISKSARSKFGSLTDKEAAIRIAYLVRTRMGKGTKDDAEQVMTKANALIREIRQSLKEADTDSDES